MIKQEGCLQKVRTILLRCTSNPKRKATNTTGKAQTNEGQPHTVLFYYTNIYTKFLTQYTGSDFITSCANNVVHLDFTAERKIETREYTELLYLD